MAVQAMCTILALICIIATVEQGFGWKIQDNRQRRSLEDNDKVDDDTTTVDTGAFDSILVGLESQISTMIEAKLSIMLPKAIKKHIDELGVDSLTGEGLIGPPGLTGPIGPQGPPGPKGERGRSISHPTVKEFNLDKVSMETDEVTFECRFAGIPIPTVEWTSNVLNFTQKDYVLGDEGEVRSYFTAYVSSRTDEGSIKCKATNIAGDAEANGNLSILMAPTVEESFNTHTAVLGFNTTFPIMKVYANPSAHITWSKKYETQSQERFVQKNGVLTIVDVKAEDEGIWTFTATNTIGTYTTDVLLNTYTLGFGQKPPPTYFVKELPAELICEVFGDTSVLSAQWERISGKDSIMTSTEVKTPSSLKIVSNATELGYYLCRVTGGPTNLKAFTELKWIEKYDGYSEWSEFSTCNKCDGVETSHRNRTCETPDPEGTGTTCKVLGEVDIENGLCSETRCHGCVYQSGDGGDGGEEKIGEFENEADCAAKCMKRRETNSEINGASVDVETGKKCWCEIGMTNSNGSNDYKSCIFPEFITPTTPPY